MTETTESISITGGWRALLGRRYLGTSIVLAGGVAMYSINEFLTTSLLPSAVVDIGGERLYSWTTTLYLVGSIMSATTVYSLLVRIGARLSYSLGLAVFAIGSVVCALAPSMEVLVAGRTLQGTAGGLLAGLSYALINSTLPESLWTRGCALVSMMWGVATLVGPTTGGVFAEFGAWRWAFWAVVLLAGALAILVSVVLAASDTEQPADQLATKIPIWSLLLLGAAALAISIAQLPRNPAATAGLLLASVVLVVVFVVVERRVSKAVLPPSVFGSGPLKWILLTLAALMATATVTIYVPLFGQRLAHLSPVAAGFLGVAVSFGWSVSEIASASLSNKRVIERVVVTAPLVMVAGLLLAVVIQRDNASMGTVGLWGLALGTLGIGIGAAWPHLSAWSMSDVDNPREGSEAAAAINIVQLISGAFGAGVAGVVVNTVVGADVTKARWLFAVFLVVALGGLGAAYRTTRRRAAPVR